MKPAVDRLQLLQRLGVYGLLLLVLLAVSVFVKANLLMQRPVRLRLGAGGARGEAFALAQALAVIAVRHAPEIVVEVVETAGSEENFRLLERGELELAFVQVDTPSSASARLVAMLYADLAQLVARESSDIKGVADLRGRRVSLPPNGSGQWNTFWAIAEHFGLTAADITIVPQTGREAIASIVAGEIDAIFHVQSVFNRDVSELVASTSVRFVPIDQTEALQLLRPGCQASIVPRGVYRGVPAVPLVDTPSLAVQRVLIARAGCTQAAVSKITELLLSGSESSSR